jgi:glycogen debranching enzyme
MTPELPGDDLTIGDRYYIVSSSIAADLPKLVIKHQESFLVADTRGNFPGLADSEFGFYVDGTRFLRHLELRLFNSRPIVLNAALADDTLQAAVDLTNPDVLERGHVVLVGHTIRLARLLTLYENQLYQNLTVESFAREPRELALSWHFAADFVDVFEVRGFTRARRGTMLPARFDRDAVHLSYRGLDEIVRGTHLAFDPPPDHLDQGQALYRLSIPPEGRIELSLIISATVEPGPVPKPLPLAEVMLRRREASLRLRREGTVIETDHEQFNHWLERSRHDLHMLLTATPSGLIPYAGIPWYVTPFGRDSLITALQLVPFEPEIARGTLRFLARHQGAVDDDFTDQQPGKILHEYRRGELAECREIPFIPYYGTVDATPLYLMLLAEYLRWTGDVALARELWPAAERALDWILGPGAPDADGYLKYLRRSPAGLENQGWKDSRDAIMHASGALATPPIALVEVQGYQYAALLSAAEVAEAIGRDEVPQALRERARFLRDRFEADFWLPQEGFYALALDGDGRPCRVISSNPGHCLWTGIVAPARAETVAKRLMSEDMFTGWGIRTLSARESLYNPMSYHNGSVWPHDSAIAAIGMRTYGFTEPFLRVATGLFHAVLEIEDMRMPELFCGFNRLAGYGPTRYPVACSPQAWAAGVVFQLLRGILALVPDATENRLTLNRPALPAWLSWIRVHGLRLRDSSVDLIVSRSRESAAVELLGRRGDAEVLVRR